MAPQSRSKYEHGLAGRSSRAAGAGGKGGFLSVLLSPSSRWTGDIYVEGTGTWEGKNLEVPPGHDLFLSPRGGDDGDGDSIGDQFSVQYTVTQTDSEEPAFTKQGNIEFKTPLDNDESFQYIEVTEPAGEAAFNQVFCVPDSSEPFSQERIWVGVFLAESGGGPSRFSPVPLCQVFDG
ncbi:hypothetical protein DL768_003061 [Monosporascus sp. mg162]|nr:hypothetical protein DL768_003061 [Monosporascus sp. mg162]